MAEKKVQKAVDAARALFEDRICTLFRERMSLEESYPKKRRLSATGVMEEIGAEEGYSGIGIRRILVRCGVYTPTCRRNKHGKRVRTKSHA